MDTDELIMHSAMVYIIKTKINFAFNSSKCSILPLGGNYPHVGNRWFKSIIIY